MFIFPPTSKLEVWRAWLYSPEESLEHQCSLKGAEQSSLAEVLRAAAAPSPKSPSLEVKENFLDVHYIC